MSNKVDTRVVRMEFDNAQFEKKVKQTTKSLDQLNQSMNFQDAGKGLEKVKISISAIEAAAVTAIARITNKIIDLGVQMVKSLSVDNISAGWGKFGEKTTSVATMMAQKIRIAGEEISDLGERTEVVAKQLELLTWFSDETSYSFTDMVNNVGKFTAAGQDLDKSVKAMEGIATWAALSGQNATTASRAMYQLAQAMGKGKIQKIDWMSIQNANMDTEEFRETILKTAVAMGELTQQGDKFVTKTGKKFTQSQFAEFLSEGWFTSDVLVEGLNKYSAAIDQIYKLAEENGMTASEVIEEFGDQLDEFGVKAFKAAQEARTFTDVLNSVKDAVSSKWMTTFENIFGNQEEAVKLWTDLANELYDVFAESGNFRNNVLDIWKSIGGRNDIFKKGGSDQGAFWNIYDAIRAVLDTIKDAWNTIFPLSTMEKANDQAEEIGRNLKIITSNIRSATQAFVNNKEILNTISRVSKLIFSFVKSTINVLRLVRFVLDPIIELGKQLISRIFDNVLTFLEKFNSSGLDLERIAIGLRNRLIELVSVIKVDRILEILFVIINKIIEALQKLPDLLKKLLPLARAVAKVIVEIGKILLRIPSILNDISIKFTGNGIIENLTYILNKILSLFKAFVKEENKVVVNARKLARANDSDSSSTSEDGGITSPIMIFLHGLSTFVLGVWNLLKGLLAGLGKVLQLLGTVFSMLGNTLTKVFSKQKLESTNEKIWGIVLILGLTTAIIAILGNVIKNVGWALTGLLSPLTNLSDAISSWGDSKLFDSYAHIIDSITNGLLKIAIAMAVLAAIKYDEMWKPLLVLAIVIAGIAGILLLLTKSTEKATNSGLHWLKYTAKFKNVFKEGIQNVFKSFTGVIEQQQQINKIWAIVGFIQTLSNAMVKVALAMLIIDKVSWEGVAKSMIVLHALLGGILLISTICKNGAVDIRNAYPGLIAMLAMAGILRAFGKTTLQLASIDWSKGWPAILAVILYMTSMTILMGVLSRIDKNDIKKAKAALHAMAAISLALLAFATTMKILSYLNWEQFGIGILSIVAFMSVLAGFILLITRFAGGGNFIPVIMSLATAIMMFTTALIPFTVAMTGLSLLGWKGLAIGIIGVASSFIVLGLTAVIVQKIIPVILALSSAVLLIGVGMLAAGLGLQAFAIGLAMLAATAVPTFTALIAAFTAFGPEFMESLGKSFGSFFTGLIEGFTNLMPAIMKLIEALFEHVIDFLYISLPRITGAVVLALAQLLAQIAEASELISESIFTIIESILTALDSHADAIFDKVFNILHQLLHQLALHIPDLVVDLIDILDQFTKALFDPHTGLGTKLESWTNLLFGFIVDVLKALTPKAIQLAGLVTALSLVIIAASIRMVIASLGALGKLLTIFVASLLLLITHIFIGMNNVLVQVFITLVKESVKALVEAMIQLSNLIMVVGSIFGKLFMNGLLKILYTSFKWLIDLIDFFTGGQLGKKIEQAFTNMDNNIRSYAEEALEGIGGGIQGVQNAINQASANINEVINMTADAATDAVNSGINAIADAVGDAEDQLGDTFEKLGNSVVSGFADGIESSNAAADAVEDMANDVVDSTASTLDIHSPSRVMMRIGEFITEGLSVGIQNGKDSVVDNMAKVLDSTIGIAEDILEDQEGNDITLVVGLDTSNVEAQAAKVNDIMSSINNPSLSLYGKNADYASASMKSGEMSDSAEVTTDKSTKVTYNNTFNISSTDPQESAEEIDKKLKEQSLRAKYARGGI